MPCPLFIPDLDRAGLCASDPAGVLPVETIERGCKPGYARNFCPRAAAIEADSTRLLVRSDDGSTIEIAWATERNHHPLAVGTLRIARSAPDSPVPLEAQGPPGGQTCAFSLRAQAVAAAQAYLRCRPGHDGGR